jgi:hypothetical protein
MSSGGRLLLFGVDAGDWTLIQHCANRTILILDLAPTFLVAAGVKPRGISTVARYRIFPPKGWWPFHEASRDEPFPLLAVALGLETVASGSLRHLECGSGFGLWQGATAWIPVRSPLDKWELMSTRERAQGAQPERFDREMLGESG